MSISDLYSSGKHKQEIGHFANMVKIAKEDGRITEAEKELLTRVGKNLNITPEEFTVIFNNPEKFPTNPPVNYDERIERLFRLTKMLMVDGEAKLKEILLLQKIAVRLHFSVNNAEIICAEAIDLFRNKTDLEGFIKGIKKVDNL